MYSMTRSRLTVCPVSIRDCKKPLCKGERSATEIFERGFHQQPALQGYNIMSGHEIMHCAGLRSALGRTHVFL